MSATEGSAKSNRLTWDAVRNMLSNSGKDAEWRNVRSWTTKQKAKRMISKFGREFSIVCDKSRHVSVGDYGICRYRELSLLSEPDRFARETTQQLYFSDIYSIKAISEDRKWVKVATRLSAEGWLEVRNHLYISRGEYKILDSKSNNRSLNFLVNTLAQAR